jgi:hypothetical protein
MAGLSSWVDGHFNIIQTVGIIGSLWLGILAACQQGWAAHREANAKEAENLLTLAGQHRDLWDKAIQNPELDRILRADTDVVAKPATPKETVFLNLVIAHWLKSWRMARGGGLVTMRELGIDAHAFFSLPLPHAVWEKTKSTRNPKFVRFVERAMK